MVSISLYLKIIIYKVNKTSSEYLFNIQTVQSGAFRVLVEALKDILTDCNFIVDETGIKLIATDNFIMC